MAELEANRNARMCPSRDGGTPQEALVNIVCASVVLLLALASTGDVRTSGVFSGSTLSSPISVASSCPAAALPLLTRNQPLSSLRRGLFSRASRALPEAAF